MKRRLKTIVLVAVVIYIIWKFLSGLIGGFAGGDSADEPKHLTGRVWLERLPKSDRDMVHGMLMVKIRKHRLGALIYGSAYRRTFDMMEWSVEGKDLTVLLKQDEVTKKYGARTWSCKGE